MSIYDEKTDGELLNAMLGGMFDRLGQSCGLHSAIDEVQLLGYASDPTCGYLDTERMTSRLLALHTRLEIIDTMLRRRAELHEAQLAERDAEIAKLRSTLNGARAVVTSLAMNPKNGRRAK